VHGAPLDDAHLDSDQPPADRPAANQDSTVGMLAAALLNLSPADRAKLAEMLVAGDG
jgi:hypothetical protein